MTEPDDTLETDLRSLRPREPSAALTDRIAREIYPPAGAVYPPTRHPFRRWWIGLTLAATGLAAGFAAFFLVTRPVDAFVPVSVTDIYLPSENQGVVTLADGTPALRVRYQWIESYTWANPRTEAVLEYSQPREEIRDIPLIYN